MCFAILTVTLAFVAAEVKRSSNLPRPLLDRGVGMSLTIAANGPRSSMASSFSRTSSLAFVRARYCPPPAGRSSRLSTHPSEFTI